MYYTVKTLLDPNLLPNSGMFECIEIRAEPGTLVNPRFPAAVGARSITCNKIARALFGAFAELLPAGPRHGRRRTTASRRSSSPARAAPVTAVSSIWRPSAVAWARGCDADGMEAIHVHLTNTSNLPAEALENEYALLVDEYALVPDSGGAGRHRGGLGIARQIRAMRDGIVFSVRSDGHLLGAPGLAGGRAGRHRAAGPQHRHRARGGTVLEDRQHRRWPPARRCGSRPAAAAVSAIRRSAIPRRWRRICAAARSRRIGRARIIRAGGGKSLNL